MPTTPISTGVVHQVPSDLKKLLLAKPKLLATWNSLTPLARNEWICWIMIVKQAETRQQHLERLQADLSKGKRRPCCWPGCPHRRPAAQKWFGPRLSRGKSA